MFESINRHHRLGKKPPCKNKIQLKSHKHQPIIHRNKKDLFQKINAFNLRLHNSNKVKSIILNKLTAIK